MKLVLRLNRVDGETKSVGDITVAILSLLIVISLIPILLRNTPNYVYYGLTALYFLLTINFYLRQDAHKRITLYLLLLYLGMLGLYKILGISSAAFSYYSTIVKYYIFLVIMLGIVDSLTIKQKKTVIFVITISIVFTMVQNLQLFLRYGAIRFARLFLYERFTTNSVNTAYISALMFFGGILFVVFLHQKRGLIKFAALILSIVCILFNTVIAQRMIVLALSVLMYPLLILFNAKRKRETMIFSMILFLIFFLLFLNYDFILNNLEKNIDSYRLSVRLNQIRNYLATGNTEEAGGSLAARSRLMRQSVQSWLSSIPNFFFGVGDHRANNQIIGNHSYFLDELGRYGLFGAIIWISLLRSYFKQIVICSGIRGNARLTQQTRVLFFIFLMRGLLGGSQEVNVGVQMFIFLPVVFSLLSKQETVPLKQRTL